MSGICVIDERFPCVMAEKLSDVVRIWLINGRKKKRYED